jgi:hypothetical protein
MSAFEQLAAVVVSSWTFVELMFWLIAGHAVADYALQNKYLSAAKSPHTQEGVGIWPWALFMHAMIHGAFVAYATGYIFLGILEVISHAWIDRMKSEGRLGQGAQAHMRDQALHILCKLVWALVVITV